LSRRRSRLQVSNVRRLFSKRDSNKPHAGAGADTLDASSLTGFWARCIGSLYHPNFINFHIGRDVSPGYLLRESNGAGSTGGSGSPYLETISQTSTVPPGKPYARISTFSQAIRNKITISSIRKKSTRCATAQRSDTRPPHPVHHQMPGGSRKHYGGSKLLDATRERTDVGPENKRASASPRSTTALTNYTLDEYWGTTGEGRPGGLPLVTLKHLAPTSNQAQELHGQLQRESNYNDSPIEISTPRRISPSNIPPALSVITMRADLITTDSHNGGRRR